MENNQRSPAWILDDWARRGFPADAKIKNVVETTPLISAGCEEETRAAAVRG